MGVRLRFREIILFLLLLLVAGQSPAQEQDSVLTTSLSISNPDSTISAPVANHRKGDEPKLKPKRRLVAALLCVALGPFGMHRLYLGTKPHVAAAYTLTLGGGIGLVPLIDLFHIVFDPNLYKYKDNNKFIMWLK